MRVSRMLGGGLVAGLLAIASGCAAPSPQLGATPSSAAPLQARIFPPYYGEVPIAVNKAAYVALFEVLPGRGVSLLYPRSGNGFTTVRDVWIPVQYNAQRWLYASHGMGDVPAGQWSGFEYGFGAGYGLSSRSMRGAGAPRYLFLVASEEPIATGRFQQSLSSIKDYLGVARYASYQPYDVMEQLAYALAPYGASDESWVTDVFVDWGYDWGYGYTPGTAAMASSWQPILCSNGTVGLGRWVPGWGYDTFSCPPMQSQQSPIQPGQPGQPGEPPAENPDARGRTRSAQDGGRDRAKDGSNGRVEGQQSPEEIRSRIAQLRDEANRAQFSRELNDQLRRGVEMRHRVDYLMGRPDGRSGAMAGRSSAAGANGARSRENPARRGGSSDAADAARSGRNAAFTQPPRSREASTTPRPQTSTQQPQPGASSTPRSRDPGSQPAPSTSTPRSRPDA